MYSDEEESDKFYADLRKVVDRLKSDFRNAVIVMGDFNCRFGKIESEEETMTVPYRSSKTIQPIYDRKMTHLSLILSSRNDQEKMDMACPQRLGQN